MTGEQHKQQNRNNPGNKRRERLAQELRANLLKRKALARARRSAHAEPATESEGSTQRQVHPAKDA